MKYRPGVNQSNLNKVRSDRRSMRLKGYDYTKEGAYFITICTNDRQCNFGIMKNGNMELSPIGKMVEKHLKDIPLHFENVKLDEFIIMPNHIHGIIVIDKKIKSDNIKYVKCRGVKFNAPTDNKSQYYSNISPKSGSISVIIRTFKSAITRWCRKNGFRNFRWQRNYYDHIIRNEKELFHIRQYLINNPLNWNLDNRYPNKHKNIGL